MNFFSVSCLSVIAATQAVKLDLDVGVFPEDYVEVLNEEIAAATPAYEGDKSGSEKVKAIMDLVDATKYE
eukprot:Pgem_evm1s16506